ncbi:MAG: hypothetical protein H6658_03050 [Ardenticatenaceae bacterium]|nr:hypothetical protein [Ardenticatenaceae bacterium]
MFTRKLATLAILFIPFILLSALFIPASAIPTQSGTQLTFLPLIQTSPICNVPGDYATIQSALDRPGCAIINLTAPLYIENLAINRDVAIHGQGAAHTVLDGNANGNVVTIQAGWTVTITHLTVRNGCDDYYCSDIELGGGITNEGSHVFLEHLMVEDNESIGIFNKNPGTMNINDSIIRRNYWGVLNGGHVVINNSTISHNQVLTQTVDGGGIANNGVMYLNNSAVHHNGGGNNGGISNYHAMTITNSTIHDNEGSNFGGIFTGGTLHIYNSTISSNYSHDDGGGIYNTSLDPEIINSLTIINSTIANNIARHGGGIYGGFNLTVTNSIIANNFAEVTGGDCLIGGAISLGHNLDSDGSCNLTGTGDISGVDPLLGSLKANGGPTWTHALSPNSPAIDAGSNANCLDTDQRGVTRPIDGDGNGSAICDIGAYEYQP